MKRHKQIIKEDTRMKLRETCNNKLLFRKELEKVVVRTSRHDLFLVLKYCYNKYYDMHADVLLEVFNERIQNISKQSHIPVKAMNQ